MSRICSKVVKSNFMLNILEDTLNGGEYLIPI